MANRERKPRKYLHQDDWDKFLDNDWKHATKDLKDAVKKLNWLDARVWLITILVAAILAKVLGAY